MAQPLETGTLVPVPVLPAAEASWPPPELDANRALYGAYEPRPNRKARRRTAALDRRRRA